MTSSLGTAPRATPDFWPGGFLSPQTADDVVPPIDTLPPDGTVNAGPIAIQPLLTVQLGQGWYVANGDMVPRYDWSNEAWLLPLAVRFGKVIVQPNASWNIYFEYLTTAVYKDWVGSAVRNQFRVNVSYAIPVG